MWLPAYFVFRVSCFVTIDRSAKNRISRASTSLASLRSTGAQRTKSQERVSCSIATFGCKTKQHAASVLQDWIRTKYRGHNGHYHPGYTFIPASVETYGYLAKPLVRYLNTLSGVAAASHCWPAVTKGSFLACAHRELSVALIKCQGSVYRGCANLLARAAGRPVLPGAEVPYVD